MTSTRTLEGLKEDIIIMVLCYLDISDVLRVRSACKVLHKATKDKLIWIYHLRHLVVDQECHLPPYIKSLELLNTDQIEAITIRVARVSHAWDSKNPTPKSLTKLHLPRSVTWLRLVSGRWLFVASSDANLSSLACYEIRKTVSGSREPVAECYLVGPVQSADVEVQIDGVVIALAIKSRSAMIEILSLRLRDDALLFVRLAFLPGLSHIRLLHGDIVGCAMAGNVSIPHIIDWRTNSVYALAELPDENGCCLTISFWLDYIILTRPNDVQVFSAPKLHQPPRLLRTVPFDYYAWDVFILDEALQVPMEGLVPPTSQKGTDATIKFLVTSEDNAYLYILSLETFTMNMYHQHFEPQEWPLRLRIGSSGYRMAWISGQHGIDSNESPTLIAACLLRLTASHDLGSSSDKCFIGREVNIGGDTSEFPSLWALATFDIDDAMGLLVLGNTFGELVLCDYVGSPLDHLAYIGDDFAERDALGLRVMPQHPVEMDVPPIAYFWYNGKPFNEEQEVIMARLTSAWYLIPDADIPSGWSNDWANWPRRWAWQGLPYPGDRAWRLEYSLRFLGQPEPLLYTDQVIFLRAGGLYFFWNFEDDLFVIDNKLSLSDILANLRGDGQPIGTLGKDRSETGQNEVIQFHQILDWEKENGRNRWVELQARGGKPHPFLLSRPNDVDDDEPVEVDLT